MRRLALPFCLLAAACPDETTPMETATLDGSSTGEPTTDATLTNADSSSSEESSSGEVTTDETLDPTTESSSTDPTTSPETTGEPSECGDGMITGTEACDGDNFGDNTCQTQGFMDGFLECSLDCLGFSTSNCFVCGDNEIAGTEECDGPLDNSIDCESLGFTEGEVSCDMSTCQYDLTLCTTCGDGVQEGAEYCDMADLGGNDCASLGFTDGTLGCHNDTCGYDYSGCNGGMYVQDFEGCVMPPEFTFSGDADWSADGTSPITGACSAHNDNISDSQSAGMVLTTVWAIDGTISFSKRTDSEANFDYLEFYIDGVLQNSWAGAMGAETTEMFDANAGMHTLEWRYIKDGFADDGTDTVWVDDIVLMGGVPI